MGTSEKMNEKVSGVFRVCAGTNGFQKIATTFYAESETAQLSRYATNMLVKTFLKNHVVAFFICTRVLKVQFANMY